MATNKQVYQGDSEEQIYPITSDTAVYLNKSGITLEKKLKEIDKLLKLLREQSGTIISTGYRDWMSYYKLINSDKQTDSLEFNFIIPENFVPGLNVQSGSGEQWTTLKIPLENQKDGNYVWEYKIKYQLNNDIKTYSDLIEGPFRTYPETIIMSSGIVPASLYYLCKNTENIPVIDTIKREYLRNPDIGENVWCRRNLQWLLNLEEYQDYVIYAVDFIVEYENKIGIILDIGQVYIYQKANPIKTIGSKGVLGQSCRIRILSEIVNSDKVWFFPTGDSHDYVKSKNLINEFDLVEYNGEYYSKFYDILIDDITDSENYAYYIANNDQGFPIYAGININGNNITLNLNYWKSAKEYGLLKSEVALIKNLISDTVSAEKVLITSTNAGETKLHSGLLNGLETRDILQKYTTQELSSSDNLDNSETKIRFFAGLNDANDSEYKGTGFNLNGDVSNLRLDNSNFYITADGTVYARKLMILNDTTNDSNSINSMINGSKASKRITTYALLPELDYSKEDLDELSEETWKEITPSYESGPNRYLWSRIKFYNVNDLSEINLLETVYEYKGDLLQLVGVPGPSGDVYNLQLSQKSFSRKEVESGANVTVKLFKIPEGNTTNLTLTSALFTISSGTMGPNWEEAQTNLIAVLKIPKNDSNIFTVWAKTGSYIASDTINILSSPAQVARVRNFNNIPDTEKFYSYEPGSTYEYYDIVTIVRQGLIKYYKYVGRQGAPKMESPTPGEGTPGKVWVESEEQDFIHANTIISSTISSELADFKDLLIKDENGDVVAGMIGRNSTHANHSNGESDIKIFSGAEHPKDATFQVHKNGFLYARNADITGKITAEEGSFTGNVTANLLTLRATDSENLQRLDNAAWFTFKKPDDGNPNNASIEVNWIINGSSFTGEIQLTKDSSESGNPIALFKLNDNMSYNTIACLCNNGIYKNSDGTFIDNGWYINECIPRNAWVLYEYNNNLYSIPTYCFSPARYIENGSTKIETTINIFDYNSFIDEIIEDKRFIYPGYGNGALYWTTSNKQISNNVYSKFTEIHLGLSFDIGGATSYYNMSKLTTNFNLLS